MVKRVKFLQRCFLALFLVVCYLFIVLDIHKSEMFASSPTTIQNEHPWFMKNGEKRPVAASRSDSGRRLAKLWPEEKPGSDRIVDQLMFIPPNSISQAGHSTQTLKKIFIFNHNNIWNDWVIGQNSFISDKCPVDSCTLVDRKNASDADAVIFNSQFPLSATPWHRPSHQLWILHFLESPYHTPDIKYNDQFNWTATYRSDSEVVNAYERWEYYEKNVKLHPPGSPDSAINWAANKTKQVAWFVSNCNDQNGRLNYAEELSKYISVDVYGKCGNKTCPRSTSNSCFSMLQEDYKFYLAFENSNCKDYITEKFFVNALGHNVIPIVMGARPVDYERSAPFNSYIHVDEFATPQELAAYLHKLDKNDDLYNEYFQWKGTGEFINTHFFCRLCAMLHDPEMPRKNYKDVTKWWSGPETCVDTSWREHQAKQTSF